MGHTTRYPIGIQHFPSIIEEGYAYVDKTSYVKKLTDRGKYFFLSRPRRFGKSLFVTTLQAYFEGRRNLFKGLALDNEDVDWTPRPVIKMTLNTIDIKNEWSVSNYISDVLNDYEGKYGITEKSNVLGYRFEKVIQRAYEATGQKVTILIDEYDAPLLNTLKRPELNKSCRDTLKAVFSVLKSADEFIGFAFVTGVSRFSHTSLFSGANNLKDISLETEYSGICGITEEEFETNFEDGILEFASSEGIPYNQMVANLKENYDGYHFSRKSEDIYNPFSLLNALDSKKISNYWFSSGTPTYLIECLRDNNFYLPELNCIESTETELSTRESYMQNPISLLYEAGYITIMGYDAETEVYTLGIPNKEVSVSFSDALLRIYSNSESYALRNDIVSMRRALVNGKPEMFMNSLQSFMHGNPYGLTEISKREKYFQNNLFLILRVLGFMPRAEEQTCNARMDVLLRTLRFVYIFELKTNGSADRGMNQINEKGYAVPYAIEGRQVIKISANYNSADNNIDSWNIEHM